MCEESVAGRNENGGGGHTSAGMTAALTRARTALANARTELENALRRRSNQASERLDIHCSPAALVGPQEDSLDLLCGEAVWQLWRAMALMAGAASLG